MVNSRRGHRPDRITVMTLPQPPGSTSAPAPAGDPLTLRFHPRAEPGTEQVADVLACEAEVFGRWYGNSREMLDHAYGGHLAQTSFVSVARGPQVVGFARLIRPGRHPLKTLQDLAEPPWNLDAGRTAAAADLDLARTWDVTTLGVLPEPGTADPSPIAALIHGLSLALAVNDVRSVVAIIDARVRRLFGTLGRQTHPLPGATPASYLGSASSLPVYGHVAALLADLHGAREQTHLLLGRDAGPQRLVVPPPDAFRIEASGAGQRVVRLPDEALVQQALRRGD
jgi:hypothetical protein